MAYGCVYTVTSVPPNSEYEIDSIVVLACTNPCVATTLPTGEELSPLAEECMEYPPERSAAAHLVESKTKDGVVFRKKT